MNSTPRFPTDDDERLRRKLTESIAPEPLSDDEIEQLLDHVEPEPISEAQAQRILRSARDSMAGDATGTGASLSDRPNNHAGSTHSQTAQSLQLGTSQAESAGRVTETETSSPAADSKQVDLEQTDPAMHVRHASTASDAQPRLDRGRSQAGRTNHSRGAGSAVLLAMLALSVLAALIHQTVLRDDEPREVGVAALAVKSESAAEVMFQLLPLQVRELRESLGETDQLQVGRFVRTGARDHRRVRLPDGSILYVNEQTHVELTGPRQVDVLSGEVFVEVAQELDPKLKKKPFVVATPDRSVTALGTQFAVRATPDDSQVIVTQGRVAVSGVEQPLAAGQQLLLTENESRLAAAPRASEVLDWTRDLIGASAAALVPDSQYAGGALVTVDPNGQESRLALRKYHVDVHIEDGFARTTIDQTYFNATWSRQEGTFHFPLPADASLSRLAMYVNGKLMEGGMAERQHARNTFETIRHQRRDPALLEWVDGSTFKMRVFPLEPRQEKRIVISYTQRLDVAYGRTHYRFPAGHSLEVVRDWSTRVVVKNGAEWNWSSPSHELEASQQGSDLVLQAQSHMATLDQDLTIKLEDNWSDKAGIPNSRFAQTMHEGHRYLMLRYRPELEGDLTRPKRHWVFLVETSSDRDPLLARVQIEVIQQLLKRVEHDDTFSVVTAGTRAASFRPAPLRCSNKNIKAAIKHLEQTHLIGAVDLQKGIEACRTHCDSPHETFLVHLGSAIPVLGERSQSKLLESLPQNVRYVGVGVGKRWSRSFMRSAASRTSGHFTQINPDEQAEWRAVELLSTLNAPRLLEIEVTAKGMQSPLLTYSDVIAQGEEICAMARLPREQGLPKQIIVSGLLGGKKYRSKLKVTDVAQHADYIPRSWARLEIDRLLAADAERHKPEIIELSKQMYVMSPYTSLLVLESEDMYAQYKVDRGRKDHWALYGCPESIPVVVDASVNGTQQRTLSESEAAPGQLTQLSDSIVSWDKPQFAYTPITIVPVTSEGIVTFTVPHRQYYPRFLYFDDGLVTRSLSRSGQASAPVWGAYRPDSSADVRLWADFGDVDFGRYERMFETESLRLQISGAAQPQPTSDPTILSVRPQLYFDIPRPIRLRIAQQNGGRPSELMLRELSRFRTQTSSNRNTEFSLGLPKLRKHFAYEFDSDGLVEAIEGGAMWGYPVLTVPSYGWARQQFNWNARDYFLPVLGAPSRYGYAGRSEDLRMTRRRFLLSQLNGRAQFTDEYGLVPSRIAKYELAYRLQPGTIVNDIDMAFQAQPLMELKVGEDSEFLRRSLDGQTRLELEVRDRFQKQYSHLARGTHRWNVSEFDGQVGDASEELVHIPRFGPMIKPVFGGDRRLFGDLVSMAPGMNTTPQDVLALLSRELKLDDRIQSGPVDPQARELIDQARRHQWESVTRPGTAGLPGMTVVYDGQGRFSWERILASGLRERVVCDGQKLWHTYPEINLATSRPMNRHYAGILKTYVPWMLSSADELALGAEVRLLDQLTVEIIPLPTHVKTPAKEDDPDAGSDKSESDKSDADTSASDSQSDTDSLLFTMRLRFSSQGRLVEKQLWSVAEDRSLLRIRFAENGTVEVLDGQEQLLQTLELHRATAAPPQLSVDNKKLVVVPMPIRSGDHVIDAAGGGENYDEWSEAHALALIASDCATGNVERTKTVLSQRFLNRGDRRPGLFVLAASRTPTVLMPEHGGLQIEDRDDPLLRFVREYVDWNRTGNDQAEFSTTAPTGSFLSNLATGRNLYTRWKTGLATQDRTLIQQQSELESALEFISQSRNILLAWSILSVIPDQISNPELRSQLPSVLERFEQYPVLSSLARQMRIDAMFKAGQADDARQLFAETLRKTVAARRIPQIDEDLRAQFRSDDVGQREWQTLVQDVVKNVASYQQPLFSALVSIQLRELGDEAASDQLFDQALARLDSADLNRPQHSLAMLLAIEQLRRLEQLERAEQLMARLLTIKAARESDLLWRYAGQLADAQQRTRSALERFERAVTLSYQHRPEIMNLQQIRADYQNVLDRYEAIIDASQTLESKPPAGLRERIVAIADQWRQLDDDDTPACHTAARLLTKLGLRELAWDYLVTPLATNPNQSDSWKKLAQILANDQQVEWADVAYDRAFELEQTNPQILLEHAKFLLQQQRSTKAEKLFERITNGQWQTRFRETQQQAVQILSAIRDE